MYSEKRPVPHANDGLCSSWIRRDLVGTVVLSCQKVRAVISGEQGGSVVMDHAKGAERAARRILEKFGKVHPQWLEACTKIVEEETSAPDLLLTLETIRRDDS